MSAVWPERRTTSNERRHAGRRHVGRRSAERGRFAPDLSTTELLRRANEKLVIASLRAREVSDVAVAAAVKMTHQAKHDGLTGLPNRMLLRERLVQSIALAQRHGKRVALMYLDIDHFKQINDTLGHTVGDHLLQLVARRLQACVRLSDTMCRQGGDEFVILLAEVDTVHDVALSAQKLIEAMAEPHLIDGDMLQVTLSIGVSVFPDHGLDAETVVKNADIAMYYAKRGGRNNYQIFNRQMKGREVPRA
ncbi:MAG: GGDEF domain-containing protein [Rhodocyclaceae bacterium]|nr:GGDEF domain-containing protein [Rhodocyclaceae bacterium]MDZ4213431.1 GGDEF domain-containing protein [Rhodocyclaceae bacterium]